MVSLQKIRSLLLVFLLTLLGLELVQPSYGQNYRLFQQQHVDSGSRRGTNAYCNSMMQRRGLARPRCKSFNTFICNNLGSIVKICNSSNIRCRNGQMNCHRGRATVTDCRLIGGSSPNCRYQSRGHTRQIVIACNGNSLVPVHFDC